jgi:hypothetical protein
MPTVTDLPTVHAELITTLKAISAHFSNAAYFLDHPETYSDDAKTCDTSAALISMALRQVDYWKIREQGEQLANC